MTELQDKKTPEELQKLIERGEIVDSNKGRSVIVEYVNPATKIPETKMIYKKREYAILRKMISEGKYKTAILASKILKVDEMTIADWLHTKPVINAMENSINVLVDKIESSQDWRAQAYLLDNILPDKQSPTGNTTILGLSITLQK